MRRRTTAAWRWLLICCVLGLAVIPAVPLLVATLGHDVTRPLWTRAFARALRDTLILGAGVALLALAIGLPVGLLTAVYRFPGRATLLLFQALPLLLPSFLLCIGWSNLAAAYGPSALPAPDGLIGCVLVLGVQAVPLPLLATWAACQNLTASQIDAARLQGGERQVLKLSAMACAPVAVVAAVLGGILALSDPGAPLIFGCRSIAVEIRTSFAALFDYQLAGRQCLTLAGLVLLLTAPLLIFGLRRFATAMLAHQTRPPIPYAHPTLRWLAVLTLLAVLLVGLVIPAVGLCLPAIRDPMLTRAWQKVAQTAGTTLIFTGGAGIVAVVLATVVALAAGTDRSLRLTTLAALLALLAMPPALAAIGVSRLATQAPPHWDWLTRSQLTVALVLGLRFLPVAAIVMLRAVGSLAPSWTEAARLHGVSAARLLVRVLLPILAPAIVIGVLLVMVLAAADITTTHLLQPPGKQSLPVAIFTVMANSPEGLVASLCLVDLLCVVTLLAIASQLTRLGRRGVR
jgi:iron(III) transport system permease protein